jgi:hypothetical protein
MLISLPADWLNCVWAMMNEEQVSSTCVIAALKAKSLCQKARGGKHDPIVVAAPTVVTPPAANNNSKSCSFCKQNGHDLTTCNNLAKVIKDHKAQRHQEFLAKQGGDSSSIKEKSSNSKSSSVKGKSQARAGLASVVELNDFSSNDDGNLSGSAYSSYEISRAADTSLASRISLAKASDFNLDSGCSILMTPFISSINNMKTELIPICLADNTVVNYTHSGRFPIPLGSGTSVKTLVVPSLHKPLLSISSVCDKGLTVCFDHNSC